MISFKTFLTESALDRKITKGDGGTPIDIPGASVVHHDPVRQLTVYHLKTPEACYTWGSGSKWCTATKRREFAHEYTRKGKVFGIHLRNNRFQAYHPVSKKENDHYNPSVKEFRDLDNAKVDLKGQVNILGGGKSLEYSAIDKKMRSTKHVRYKGPDWEPPPHPYHTMPEKDVVKAVKNLPNDERLSHYRAITNDGSIVPHDEELRGINKRFDKRDLHHFSDDPVHHSYIASHAPIDTITHMANHPDTETRRIVQQRIKFAGGHLLKPNDPGSSFEHHPNQFGLKFPKVDTKKKAQ